MTEERANKPRPDATGSDLSPQAQSAKQDSGKTWIDALSKAKELMEAENGRTTS